MNGRSLTDEDVKSVVALDRTLNITPWTESMFLEELRLDSYGRVLVNDSATIVGYLVARLLWDEWHLLTIGVAVGYQRMGLAKELMRGLMTHGQRTISRAVLLEVRVSNLPAIKLYTSFGFVTVGVRKNYYLGPHESEDALVMERQIFLDD